MVYLNEGEKAADEINSRNITGVVGTCPPTGTITKELANQLRDKCVVIFVDRDDEGLRKAAQWYEALLPFAKSLTLVQSKTRITYRIADQGFRQFRCLVGIDDAAGDGGSVIFRVYLDGKKVHETAVLRGGAPTVKLVIALKGAKELSLEADYADNGHVNDLADWVNPILLK